MPRVIFLLLALLGLAGVFVLSSLTPTPTTLAAPSVGSDTILVCSAELNTEIPNNNVAGINIPIQVTDTAPIEDLDVIIDLDHDFVGDLEIYLSNGATNSTILRRPNNGAGECRGDDLQDVVANDQVGQSLNANCNDVSGGGLAYEPNGNYRPGDPGNGTTLTVYNGASTAGQWTLNVRDVANGASEPGTFQNWCLRFTVPPLTPTPTATATSIPTATPTATPVSRDIFAPLVLNNVAAATPPPTPTCLTVEDETLYPNNTTQQAAGNIPLCVSQPFRGKHNIPADREDIYKLVIAQTGAYSINLDVADVNLSLLLYDANRNLVAESVTVGLADERIERPLEAGTYYVRVYRVADNVSEQEYQLLISPN